MLGRASTAHTSSRRVRSRSRPGDTLFSASDGLMRLIDIFGRYASALGLLEACNPGLTRLLGDVRAAETEDADFIRFPRAKVHDDATGVLIRVG